MIKSGVVFYFYKARHEYYIITNVTKEKVYIFWGLPNAGFDVYDKKVVKDLFMRQSWIVKHE